MSTPPALPLIADVAAHCRAFWTVATKSGEKVPLVLNAAQRIVLAEIAAMIAARLPVRMVVVKARQGGMSTFFCALLQHLCQTHIGRRALIVADRLELPRQWLRRAQGWVNETPADIRPLLAASNALELFFEDIDSRLSIGSESGTQPGMGFTLHYVVLSEVASWRRYTQVAADLLPAVPQTPGTIVILESTGEMEGDDFHREALRAKAGESGARLVFLPFWLSAEYTMPTALTEADYTPEECELVQIAKSWAIANPKHAKIAKFSSLTPGVMAWRRWVIANEFSGDVEMFKSRYPAEFSDAFMSPGRLAIPAPIVRRHTATAKQALGHYRLSWTDEKHTKVSRVQCEPGDPLGWAFYEEPVAMCEYAIGGDVASGKQADSKDLRSERDFATVGVLNRRTLVTAATFRSRVEGDVLGEEMLKAGCLFNNAWMASEVNQYGWATLMAIRSYTWLMSRDGPPDDPAERSLNKLCWETTNATRNLLIDDWIKHSREEPGRGWEGKVRCLCPLLAAEERTFVTDAQGKRQHRPGCHDDVLFGYMIALQVHLRCPHVHREEEIEAAKPKLDLSDPLFKGACDIPAMAYAGQPDNWDPSAEDQDL